MDTILEEWSYMASSIFYPAVSGYLSVHGMNLAERILQREFDSVSLHGTLKNGAGIGICGAVIPGTSIEW